MSLMNQFTELTDAKSIEALYQKSVTDFYGDMEKMEELRDILDNQMWKAWEDKTIDAKIVYVYDRLKQDLEKRIKLVHWAQRFRERGDEHGAKDIEKKIIDFKS